VTVTVTDCSSIW